MTFKTREEYKAFVQVWKSNYKELSLAIRKYRKSLRRDQSLRARKKLMRHAIGKNKDGQLIFDNPHIERQFELLRKDSAFYLTTVAEVTDNLSMDRGFCGSALATQLIELRHASKIEAQRQYENHNDATVVIENNLTVTQS